MFQLLGKEESGIGVAGKYSPASKRPFTIVWYAAVVFLGLTFLYTRSFNGAQDITGTFLECIIPGSSRGSAPATVAGSSLHGAAAAADFRRHVDCFFSSDSGKWVYNGEPRYIVPNKFGSNSLHKCEAAFHNTTPGGVSGDRANEIAAAGNAADWIVREELKWEWKTDEQRCPLLDLDRDEFCRRIGAVGNMLVVGDSINQELYWILLNHLVVNTSGWKVPRSAGERLTRGDVALCEDVLGAGRGFRIGHVRNDRLSLALRVLQEPHANFYEYPWADAVEPWNISLLLLNKGAHFESDANFTESLINTFSVIKARWPNALVFFRNTPPGHAKCSQHKQPLKERQSAEELRKFAKGYHWAEFGNQNKIARRMTEEFGFVYLDLDGVLATRPDGHLGGRDCLHYCVPGPLDVFAKLFYNTLLLLDPSPRTSPALPVIHKRPTTNSSQGRS